MSKKKKKQLKLNQQIRHYFDGDGFDEGIQRVPSSTLSELFHFIAITPNVYERDYLIKMLRRMWSESDTYTRSNIVDFFKADGTVYTSVKIKEQPTLRSEKIAEILEEMDTSREEDALLFNAFIDIRSKKINRYKMESKLEHIRYDKKRTLIEKAVEGKFNLDDGLEFNTLLHYNIFNNNFEKIVILSTQPFPFSKLKNEDTQTLIAQLLKIKQELTELKQKSLDEFLKSLSSSHCYLSQSDILYALKKSPPEADILLPKLSDTTLESIFKKISSIDSVKQLKHDVVMSANSTVTLPFSSQYIHFHTQISKNRDKMLYAIWNEEELNYFEAIQKAEKAESASFFLALDALIQKCQKQANLLHLSQEELHHKIYAFLLPLLKETITISTKIERIVLFDFNHSIQKDLIKRQRQELLARTIRDFKNLFPLAREIKRRLILHVGPTNSGKTYQAMQTLKSAETGYYLAPLRLLALEGFENLKAQGIDASLITGEEQILDEDATHISSTIEMLNFEVDVDVCVIDEVQMIGDRDRGWAWANAIIGAPASTVIMTGSTNATLAVTQLAEYLNEPLEIVNFERMNPLTLLKSATPIAQIKPQSAVITFSRRDVLKLKQQLSKQYRVSVVYGNLSPEVRREEARRFREGETEVLVATDAIAMGMNLPIDTILFYKAQKFDGVKDRELSPSEIQQISGRAGRYGLSEAGNVGALKPEVLNIIQKKFHKEATNIAIPFNVMASLEHIKLVGSILEENSLFEILNFFVKNMQFSGPFRAANLEGMVEAAKITDQFNLNLAAKYHLACAPLNFKSPYIAAAYERYIRAIEQGRSVSYEKPTLFGDYAQSSDELLQAEDMTKEISLYLWLSYRFADLFIDKEKAIHSRGVLNRFIENSLKQSHFNPTCKQCGKTLAVDTPYPICQSCFRKLNLQKREQDRREAPNKRRRPR
ncbi:MAG: helicase-related protein [Campylobacterota bacterium]|nr:helicase-related protein [Campylobacterota bacterium]